MLLILILIILCAVLLGTVVLGFDASWSFTLGKILFVIAGLVAVLILFFMIRASNKPSSLMLVTERKLVALPDNFYMDDVIFYAAIGYKDGKANIVYAFEDGELTRIKRLGAAENVSIKETEGEAAYLKTYYRMLDSVFWNQFYFSKTEYVLELPKGAIRYDYTFFRIEED